METGEGEQAVKKKRILIICTGGTVGMNPVLADAGD